MLICKNSFADYKLRWNLCHVAYGDRICCPYAIVSVTENCDSRQEFILFTLCWTVADLQRNGWEESPFISPFIQVCTQTKISPRCWALSWEKELRCEAHLPRADTEPSFPHFKSLFTIISWLNSSHSQVLKKKTVFLAYFFKSRRARLEIPGRRERSLAKALVV